MRVIAGKFKGRQLSTLKGRDVRPTADRVKKSLFSIIQREVIDSDFLDLCAGSGNIGIEALSRGARTVTFIDRNARSIKTIRRNLVQCGVAANDSRAIILRMDVLKGIDYLSKRRKLFDILFLDPPYHDEILLQSLQCISELSNDGTIIAEHHRTHLLPDNSHRLIRFRQEQYGDTMLSFYSPI